VLTFRGGGGVVEILEERKSCLVCGRRVASWRATRRGGEAEPMCAWCVMYSPQSAWGYANRAELLHVGRAAQESAARAGKDVPELDPRGRLQPSAAERFLLGVVFTDRALRQLGMEVVSDDQ
jgi:hypothetical protein